MRPIDADALKKTIEKYRPISSEKSTFVDGRHSMFMDCIIEIDNAPTVEPFEPDYVGAERVKARQRGYEEGYRNGMEIGKTLNPKIKQGEWEKPFEMNGKTYHKCNHCHISSELILIDKFCPNCGADMKGGAE